jgi:Flp pilus assembly protein TadB
MASRVGSALILIALFALAIFLLTLQIGQADLRALLLGAALAALGLLLRRRGRRPRRSTRFESLRRLRGPVDADDQEDD